MINHRLSYMEMFLVALIVLLVSACGGGGGGGGGGGKKPTGPTLTMNLGTPASDPAVIPPSTTGPTQVTFLAMVTGTANPPASIQLDEIDSTGKVTPGVTQLLDDGKDADFKRGDRIFTGTLSIDSAASVEKNYRVSTTYNGKSITSNTMNLWVSDCPATSRPSDPAQIVFDSDTNTKIYSNEVMLRTNVGVAPDLAAINTIAGAANGHVVGCIPALRQYLVEITNPNTPADAAGVHAAIKTLEQDTVNVESAFPNALSLAQPFSPLTNSLLCNGLVDANCQWYLDTIGAQKAWQLAGGGDPQMGVAVIDFGVDCSLNGLPCDATLNHQDLIDHGTGVAGLLASPNNPTGMVGDAYNTYLYPYNFISDTGSQYKMSELITEALSQSNVRVVNISAGTGADFSGDIKNAVCHAISSGRLVVAAAGNPAGSDAANCELTNVYPAAYNDSSATCDNGADLQSGLLVVGATDSNHNLANWSSGGQQYCSNTKYVDLYAPGKDVITLSSEYGYATKSGTSFAAPLVSGAAAVLWAEHPGSTPKEIHDQLVGSSDPLASGSDIAGKPSLNLFHAVGGSDAITKPDTTPDSFTIPPLTGVALKGDVTSSAFKVNGIDSPAPISIKGGYYSINGNSFTDASGVVHNGDSVQVQLHTPPVPSTQVSATLTIGGVSQVFNVTTGDNSAPGSFAFPDVTNASTATSVESTPQQINTISDNTDISIDSPDGGEYAIGDGASAGNITFKSYTNKLGKINKGQWVKVRLTSPANYSHSARARLTIGNFNGDFVVRTPRAYHTPHAFSLDHIIDSAPGTQVTSTPFFVSGLNGGALISISGGQAQYGVVAANSDGGLPTYTSLNGIVHNGDQVTVQLNSSKQPGATVSAMLSIGNVHRVFRVTTKSLDITPDAFSFATLTGSAGNSTPSGTVTIYGIDDGTPISVVNGDYSIDGGAFTHAAGGTIKAGQTVTLSATLPTGADAVTAILTIGDYSTTYTVTAPGINVTPAAFSITPVNNALMREPVVSKPVPISISAKAAPAPISVSPGASYSLDNGATFTSDVGTITDGQSVMVKLTAASTPATTTTATLNIGGTTADFSVTTLSTHTVSFDQVPGVYTFGNNIKVIDGLQSWLFVLPAPGYAVTDVSGCGGSYDPKTNIYTTGAITSDCSATPTVVDTTLTPHAISGTVTGLVDSNASLTLYNNGADTIVLTGNGTGASQSFSFTKAVKTYQVTTSIDITAGLICGVNNSNGDSGRADVTNVDVECIAIPRNLIAAAEASGSFVIRPNDKNSLWAWGDNTNGLIGDGKSATVPVVPAPERIGADSWLSVSGGSGYAVAVRSDGKLWAWGLNGSAQLGTGATSPSENAPVQIGSDTHWAVVSAGWRHTLAIKTDGTLWAWGDNTFGAVGDGLANSGEQTVPAPKQIGSDNNWVTVSAGNSYSMAIKLDGTLWAWGDDDYGQIGNNYVTDVFVLGEVSATLSPVPIATDRTWSKVSAGGYDTLAITTNGTLWGWGYNGSGELGIGNSTLQSLPQQVGIDTTWTNISAGGSHSVGMQCPAGSGCSLYAWGDNTNGALGIGNVTNNGGTVFPSPQFVSSTLATPVVGGTFTLAGQLDGSVWAWGDNSLHQLGDQTVGLLYTPEQIADSTNFFYHLVGGTVSGLVSGDVVTLQIDAIPPGTTPVTITTTASITGNGASIPYIFQQAYPAGTTYTVTATPNLGSTVTSCTITNGTNTTGITANVLNVDITCK